RGGFPVALDEVRFARGSALEGALLEQTLHKGAEVEADLGPQRFVVRLKDNPLSAAEKALLEEEGEAADGNVLPLGGERVGGTQGAGAPDDAADFAERAQAIDAGRIQLAVLAVREFYGELGDAGEGGIDPGRCFPDAALPVGASEDSGDGAAGSELGQPA